MQLRCLTSKVAVIDNTLPVVSVFGSDAAFVVEDDDVDGNSDQVGLARGELAFSYDLRGFSAANSNTSCRRRPNYKRTLVVRFTGVAGQPHRFALSGGFRFAGVVGCKLY